ncbi:DUF1722 domain-containing protein [Alkalilimnicola ehrlichii]|uniref:YbgA family protein n=1 Tax=Alkalilimnicola ehrlichii TaxID=351052 RepID=UPI0021612382|nr:DUF1722 domain-containing protein [Alkalilimnicola ehrlichii]
MERVRVHPSSGQGMPVKKGRGIYAEAFMRVQPLLPVEEEGRLQDPAIRENFIGRVYAYWRWQRLLEEGLTAERLVEFHTRHKLILMAHRKQKLTELGRLLAQAGAQPLPTLADDYIGRFMAVLAWKATRQRHTDVLFHLLGYLKRSLDAGDKAEMVEVIDNYRLGQVPLIVPITLFRHHFRRHPHPYVEQQYYLSSPPAELALLNDI